ncbi:phage antirepressor KilAC domain-containing protein [Pleionea sp. CnH1-48]|uniref:phage antirepressor KilAC domain-containing protein n=1 Tax=Pleionea sp. CnH1-48 TaxID=2954494 RepID=UPI002097CCF1|nr:phage antirepressor KilAC domain-containing protein [Pleionea sp. CnH1-48]MCO7223212.1 phage antirepressor KilAC domain-containing protein [Pleionea sp. CnH1-48]
MEKSRALSIANVEIATDDYGRISLNALHRASGTGKHKAPNYWLNNKQTKEIVEKYSAPEIPGGALVVNNGGREHGTFADKVLAVSYAGWICAEFEILVNQTFLDYKSGNLISVHDANLLNLQEAQKLVLESTRQVEELKPKALVYDKFLNCSTLLCISDAAKQLRMKPGKLFQWLACNKWIFRRRNKGPWVAYQDKVNKEFLFHKTKLIDVKGVRTINANQVYVTPKGLTEITLLLSKAQEEQSQLTLSGI